VEDRVRKALSLVCGGTARLVGSVGSGAFGRRPTSAPAMLDVGVLVVGVLVVVAAAAVLAVAEVPEAVPPDDPQPATASPVPASATTAAQRTTEITPRSRTTR
jgi:hypothetical protein